jgi:UDP-glucose 4-epimerase
VTVEPRRPGDISSSVADNRKIKEKLGWNPKFDDLKLIVTHAVQWEKSLN